MPTKQQIKDAVAGLDHASDDHWTQSGLPSVEAVSSALGERVTREDINAASATVRNTAGETPSAEPGTVTAEQRDAEDADGPEPEEIFGMMDQVSAAASSPRWRRNQVLQQIRTLWANEQQSARAMQEKVEGRIERREVKREERRERAAENA